MSHIGKISVTTMTSQSASKRLRCFINQHLANQLQGAHHYSENKNKGQRLQVVVKFTYLGSTLSRVVHIDDEVNARIAKASAAFDRLRGSVWDNYDRSGILQGAHHYSERSKA